MNPFNTVPMDIILEFIELPVTSISLCLSNQIQFSNKKSKTIYHHVVINNPVFSIYKDDYVCESKIKSKLHNVYIGKIKYSLWIMHITFGYNISVWV